MAKFDVYQSKYKNFTFYSGGGIRRKFSNWQYKTDNPQDKKILNTLNDVWLVKTIEPKGKTEEPQTENVTQIAETKPEPEPKMEETLQTEQNKQPTQATGKGKAQKTTKK